MGQHHMRRSDRELTAPEELDSILRRGRFATIAMTSDGEPYAVTLSYGFAPSERALYFHLAQEGRKIDALAADPRVCATVVIDGGYEPGACKHNYESVVLTGHMRVVDDPNEARHGMRVLLAHLEDDPEAAWERYKLEGTEVYQRMSVARLEIDEIAGKAGS